MLPLSLQCRFSECLRMEKAIRLLERVPKIIPLAARVDGIYWTTDCESSRRDTLRRPAAGLRRWPSAP